MQAARTRGSGCECVLPNIRTGDWFPVAEFKNIPHRVGGSSCEVINISYCYIDNAELKPIQEDGIVHVFLKSECPAL